MPVSILEIDGEYVSKTGLVNVKHSAFGAKGDGVTDDTAAIQAAINFASSGVSPATAVYFPPGDYKVSSQISITKNYTHLLGAMGASGPVIRFNPGVAASCFKFQLAVYAGSPLYQCSVRNLTFVSDDTTLKKVALDVVDNSAFTVHNVKCISWIGAKSTFLRYAGRDLAVIDRCQVYASKPFQFLANPNAASLSVDSFHISNIEASTQDAAEYAFEFGDALGIANLDMKHINTAGGKGAVYYVPTVSVTTQLVVTIDGLRFETPGTNGFYAIEWGSSSVVTRNFTLRNANLGGTSGTTSTNKGIKLRACYTSSLNGIYTGGNVGLDVDSSVHDLFLNMFTLLDNTTAALVTGQTKIWAVPQVGGYALPQLAYYTNDLDITLGKIFLARANFSSLATYADNAAATAGGLNVGDTYRTATGVLMVRF